MKKIINILCLLIAFSYLGAANPMPAEETERLSLLLTAEQSKIWPNYQWLEAPVMLAFDNGDVFIWGMKPQSPVWKPMQVSGKQVYYARENDLPYDLGRMQPWFPVDGKEVFFYRIKPSPDTVEDVSIFAHERFHRFQNEYFDACPLGMSKDHLNIENLTYSEIEDQVFDSYLNQPSKEKIRDMLALTLWRRNYVAEETTEWENHQMQMEGLADYVATKQFGGKQRVAKMHPLREMQDDFIDEVIKWRYYRAGAAFAYALDEMGVHGWQQKVQDSQDLVSILQNALRLNSQEVASRVKRLESMLHYQERRSKMSSKVEGYNRKLNQISNDYDSKQGRPLLIHRPNQAISGGGMNKSLVFLGDGSTVGLIDTSFSSSKDGKWRFKTEKVTHLYQHNTGHREVKVSDESVIVFERGSFAVRDLIKHPGEYPFQQIKIHCSDFSLESEGHSGVLISDGATLTIEYS